MRRIIVVGCQGSGKTSLTLKLGRKLGLPAVHLDVLQLRGRRRQLLGAGLRSHLGARRYLGRHRPSALALPVAHRLAFSLRSRRDAPDLPKGCPEQFDWNLMREAWRYNADRRPDIEAERFGAEVPVVRLSRDREIDDFVRHRRRGD